jgi:hypothetical protein
MGKCGYQDWQAGMDEHQCAGWRQEGAVTVSRDKELARLMRPANWFFGTLAVIWLAIVILTVAR